MKKEKKVTKKLDDYDPGLFNRVAEYLLKKKQEKDEKNNKMITEHFNRCLK